MVAAMIAPAGLKAPALAARKSGFTGARVSVARPAVRAARASVKVAASQEYPQGWLNKSPLVLGLGFLGWTIPSSIGVPAFGGASLFGKLNEEIGIHLAQFPQGPPINDEFWLYMITWHTGLFLSLTLAQIGVQGRKQGYW